ncbi:Rab geranylgeranyltransferase [Coemansia sp. Benny D115]|nr:Rab geranylgeranyltransferase [Coemansia sp. Benny D115]
MHGRRRELVREASVDEKEQARRRVEKYRELNDLVMGMRAKGDFSQEALAATKRLLELNTELHTVWNYRRTIFLNLDCWENPQDRQTLLKQEMDFLMDIIRKNIKSYWMWGHRVWVLTEHPSPDWKRELALVERLLEADARNYHGWDYRRFVASRLKESGTVSADAVDESEFVFTTQQINKDCANHSAWHNRSKLLPGVLQRCASDEERKSILDKEIDMIINAIYTDPDDQNAWLYHEWLLDIQPGTEERCALLRAKVTAIREILELEDDSKRPLIELVEAFIALSEQSPESVSDAEKSECVEVLGRLKILDPYHIERYRDTESMLAKRWSIC